MDLSTQERAALTSALSHPTDTITADAETATALEHRGLVVGRQLTAPGIREALAIDGSYSTCAECGALFPSMRSLATTGRDHCPECLRDIGRKAGVGATINEKRTEWTRKARALKAVNE